MQGSDEESANIPARTLLEEEITGHKQVNAVVPNHGQSSLDAESHTVEQAYTMEEIPILMDVLFRGEDSVTQHLDEADLQLPKGLMAKPLDLDLDTGDLPLLTDLIPRSQTDAATVSTTELWRGVARDILAPKAPPNKPPPPFPPQRSATTANKSYATSGGWAGNAPTALGDVGGVLDFEALSQRLQDELRMTLQVELERATGEITKRVLDVVSKHMVGMLRQVVTELAVSPGRTDTTATFTRSRAVGNISGELS